MTQADAEDLGASALAFLAADVQRLVRFLELTGLTPDELRAQAQSARLRAEVLEHLLTDESLLLVFATGAGVEPETVAPAAQMLRSAGR